MTHPVWPALILTATAGAALAAQPAPSSRAPSPAAASPKPAPVSPAPAKSAGSGLAGHDSNAPVDYSADHIELQDRADRVVLSGNVDVTQADLRMRATQVTVAYTNAGSLKLQRMIATGGVVVTRGTQRATGDVAVYDLVQRVITMAGRVTLNRNGDVLNGGRLTINLATGLSSVDGRGTAPAGVPATAGRGGRVSGTFSVPKQN